MDSKILTEWALPLLTLVGVVFEAGRTRAKIDSEIQSVKTYAGELSANNANSIGKEIAQVRHSFELHVTSYQSKDELTEYKIHGLDEKIDHKFNRLHQNQKDIQGFLKNTTAFVPSDN